MTTIRRFFCPKGHYAVSRIAPYGKGDRALFCVAYVHGDGKQKDSYISVKATPREAMQKAVEMMEVFRWGVVG